MYSRQNLLVEQVDKKLQVFTGLEKTLIPTRGWIHTLRIALKMSLKQLGNRLAITGQGAREMEKREENGSITLNSLRLAGKAMNMKLVYGFIPESGSIEKMIEEQALIKAREIVLRTSQTMILEDQGNDTERISEAIKNKAWEIKYNMPNYLWD